MTSAGGPGRGLRLAACLCLVPWAGSYATYRWLLAADQRDQAEPIHRVDLGADTAALPPGARFLALSGQSAPGLVVRRELSGRRVLVVVPVVEPRWSGREPVRFVLRAERGPDTQWFFEVATSGLRALREFGCEVVGGADQLPGPVAAELARLGVPLAPDCRLLQPASFHDGKVASRAESQAWWLIPWLGGAVSLLAALGVALAWRGRRARADVAPPAPPPPSGGEPSYPDLAAGDGPG